jgi:hypothetical protein
MASKNELEYFYLNGNHYSHEGRDYFTWRSGTGIRHIISRAAYVESLRYYLKDKKNYKTKI